MRDVMLDFETFGNGKNACVVSVAAVYFDRATGAIAETFKANIDARSSVAAGAQIDADTVYFWLSQSTEARNSLLIPSPRNVTDVFNELNSFLASADQIWSHATFDFVILAETMKMLKIKPKFHYRTARDIRTLIDLAGYNGALKRVGTHHDALEDCKFQVQYCVDALNRIGKS